MEAKSSLSQWVFLFSIFLLLLPILSGATFSGPSPFGFFKNLQGCQKGDEVEDIHKVKQYLQRFGYLMSSTDNLEHDDHFDDVLETAIKTFQSYYHLSPTGILDAATTDLMSRPRCGVPDNPGVVRNNTKSQGHGHFDIGSHYAFFPDKPVWPYWERDLKYFLDTGSFPLAADAVAKAFFAWATVSPFTFQRSRNPFDAISISFQVREHGDGLPFDGPKGVLAHAFPPVSGVLHFDGDEKWATGVVPDDAFDLETAALHEIGHLLGLGHSAYKQAIMFPSIVEGEKRTITKDDMDGIRALYNVG